MQGNTGYLGVPLVATLLGTDELGAAIAYDTLVSSPLLYGVGFAIGAAFGTRAGDRRRARGCARSCAATRRCSAIALALVAPDALAPDVAGRRRRGDRRRAAAGRLLRARRQPRAEAEDGTLDFPPR